MDASKLLTSLIFKEFQQHNRFTQDSPVYPDVWLEYFKFVDKLDTRRVDLIFTPHRNSSAPELMKILFTKLRDTGHNKLEEYSIATTGEFVAARLTFHELITIALPLTNWFHNYLWKNNEPTEDLKWLEALGGAMLYFANVTINDNSDSLDSLLNEFRNLFVEIYSNTLDKAKSSFPILLWSVSKNRPAHSTIEKSIPSTKADACRRLFNIDGSEIAWAVLDTGIDARHIAFRKIDPASNNPYEDSMGKIKDEQSNYTRIIATYDFTNFRDVISKINLSSKKIPLKKTGNKTDQSLSEIEKNVYISEVYQDLQNGRILDWSILGPLLRIPHNIKEYVPPTHPHGTHVAGIIGANEEKHSDISPLIGMCPCIGMYDIRVIGEEGGNEFNILAAIQFVRWLNSQKDGLVIHGVNLSFSMNHDVANYACGQTPVCTACERLVSEGTIVVAAAGNLGQAIYQSTDGNNNQGFRTVNITDPGNAELVITVGSTHRNRPHAYGVSYFSSKGPTGDGRCKPDIVAPGEKIVSTSIDDATVRLDGTSMAAPHVSGAAALLLARHRELIGKPQRVKEILCSTATDLGREKYFQGHGMLDVLRAVQSV